MALFQVSEICFIYPNTYVCLYIYIYIYIYIQNTNYSLSFRTCHFISVRCLCFWCSVFACSHILGFYAIKQQCMLILFFFTLSYVNLPCFQTFYRLEIVLPIDVAVNISEWWRHVSMSRKTSDDFWVVKSIAFWCQNQSTYGWPRHTI